MKRQNLKGKNMLAVERIQSLRAQLTESGSVRIAEASARLGVSGETIRRYLKILSSEPNVRLVRGGAVLTEENSPQTYGILPVTERSQVRQREKEAIGECAASLVADGQSVFLDGGTTTLAVARALASHLRLKILTNNLMIANAAANFAGVNIFVIGGKLVPGSMCLVDPRVESQMAGVSVDWAFLGTAGISVQKGFTSADPFETALKRAVIKVSRKAVVIADFSKMTTSGFDTFAEPEEIDYFITSGPTDPEFVNHFQAKGVNVHQAMA